MNWLDVALLIVLVLAGFSGYKTGIIRGAVLFVGLVVGIILAGRIGGQIGENLGLLGSEGSGRLLGFVLVFGVCFAGAWILGIVIRKALNLLLLGWLDSLSGALVGFASSALVCTSIVVALGSSSMPWATTAVQESKIGSFLADKGGFVLGLFPDKYKDLLSKVSDLQQPGATVTDAKLVSITTDTAKANGVVKVSNQNHFAGTIKADYILEWKDGATWKLVSTQSKTGIPLASDGSHGIELPFDMKKQDGATANGLITALNTNQPVNVRIKGKLEIEFPSEKTTASFEKEITLQVGK